MMNRTPCWHRLSVSTTLALMLAVFAPAFAEETVPPAASQATASVQQFVDKGSTLAQEAESLVKAAHNPRVRDYYKASDLFMAAALQYELAKTTLVHMPETHPEAQTPSVEEVDRYTELIRQLRFKSHAARRMGNSRESRGLL